jgi:hypothetical protein
MERCPNCSARYAGEPICRRCGMDLSLLLRTEQAAERALQRGVRELVRGNAKTARAALNSSLTLRMTALGERLLGFIANR